MRPHPILICLCAIFCTAFSAWATPPSFRMKPLPELLGLESAAQCGRADSVRGIDMGGWSKGANGIERAVLWHLADRDCTVVPPPEVLPTLDVSSPSWVNDLIRPADTDCTAVYACGRSVNMAGIGKPVLWRCPGGAAPCTLIVLPTLVPGGIGEANGFIDDYQGPYDLQGTSRNAANVPKAVVWERDMNGDWQVGVLPHPTPGSEGAALDAAALDESTTVVAGSAENESGQMRPQVWKRVGINEPWGRTELPLLAGGTEGVALTPWDVEPYELTGWSKDTFGNRMAVRWTEPTPGLWSVESLGTLAGRIQSEGNNFFPGVTPSSLIAGTSYSTSPLVDGLATLWQTIGMTTIAFDVNSLVVGERTLEAFAMFTSSGVPWSRYFSVGSGRSLGASKSESARGVGQHALLLLEDIVTGVTPPASSFPINLSTSPNPFERSTLVSFSLDAPGNARLSVYDVQGRRVATLAEGFFAAGRHEVHWPAPGATAEFIGPGVYVVRLESGGTVQTQKIVQIR